jgi:cytoskeletal protein RodZ
MNTSRKENESHSDGFEINSVGVWLKIAREKNGIPLDEVAKVTRIGKSYLEAIEEGDLSKLPSQAYTRGFIRLYAAHLGLSPEEALSMINASQAGSAETIPDQLSNLEQIRRTPPVLATLALALGAGYLLLKPATQSSTPTQHSRVETPPAEQALKNLTTQPEQSAPPKNEPSPTPSSQQKQGESNGIILRLKAVRDGRIHITIDGSVSQEYDLVTGDLVEWKAESEFIIDLDNAGSVEGELDGVKLNPFGEPGRAAHLKLRADGTHKE